MDSRAHQHIVAKAIEWLPTDAKRFWEDNCEIMVAASCYPDIFAAPLNIAAEKAAIEPDWFNLVHADPENKASHIHQAFCPADIRCNYPTPLRHYLSRIHNAIGSGNMILASKLTGCFSHAIVDTGQPAHVVVDDVALRLLPNPSETRYMIYHQGVESFIGQATGLYHPQCLGIEPDEVVWHLVERFEALKKFSSTLYIPILSAIYAENRQAAQAAADQAVQACAELFSDVLYTIAYSHTNEMLLTSSEDLERIALSSLVPTDCFVDMMYGYSPMVDRQPNFSKPDGITYPLVDFDIGNNRKIGGLALFPNMAPGFTGTRESFVEYHIPKGLFIRLETTPGLNRNCNNETRAIFEICLDNKPVLTTPPISDEEVASPIALDLGEATVLRLAVRDEHPAPCPTRFFNPIWGDPTLIRKPFERSTPCAGTN